MLAHVAGVLKDGNEQREVPRKEKVKTHTPSNKTHSATSPSLSGRDISDVSPSPSVPQVTCSEFEVRTSDVL